jgi:hypothetical protein
VIGGVTVAWRAARSVLVLFDQLNVLYPNRSRASDGTIGDENHTPPSDHLPDARGVVRAGDYTHDPAHGADMGRISEDLRRSRDRRIKYVIFNRRLFAGIGGLSPWVWRRYTGSDPHDRHLHLSVVSSAIADDTRYWQIGEDMTPEEHAWLRYTTWRLQAFLDAQSSVDIGAGLGVDQLPMVDVIKGLAARPATVDAAALASELARNGDFIEALANAVANRVARNDALAEVIAEHQRRRRDG